MSSYDAGLTWKLLATPQDISYDERLRSLEKNRTEETPQGISVDERSRNEIIMSPAFDEDGVVFLAGNIDRRMAVKIGKRLSWINNSSC